MLAANPQPLDVSANRWVPMSRIPLKWRSHPDSPEMMDRKVKALLDKLTMERFDSLSDQIIHWANKSVNEKDGQTLFQVIWLVFEQAIDEAAWNEKYARLCRKMMEQISSEVQDDGIKNTEGKPIAGSYLFRKYLLNQCQEDFERGWLTKEATAAAAKASDDQPRKAATKKKDKEEAELYSDEYYAAQKTPSARFSMLTERAMHDCVKKLLGNVENFEEEEIESLCQLLKTAGQLLDTPKARAHMDVYFTRMKMLGENLNVGARMQFMLQDVIELRDLRQISKGTLGVMVMGPSSVFAGGKKDTKLETPSRTNSRSNMFHMLSQNPEFTPEAAAKLSRPSSRKPSVDLGHTGAPEPTLQRRKL
ncbi:armadillo-type protein [Suillus paluster]|uniref:armadillo-type protein n=1 Tax=Suillus paluster TaxID=48578 RepID=UPI001B876B70|nr:armadillo-type protein [Suillus paluster]KAG1737882.1 armadillo-type protein [Suillus paluster]